MPTSSLSPARRTLAKRAASSTAGRFLRGFLKNPAMVGSVVPSSQASVARMLAPIDWSSVRLFVEYGPGVGTFTQPVLDRLAPDAALIAIDTHADFVTHLRSTIRDPRLTVVQGSAADVEAIVRDHGHEGADIVLSGLPFSALPVEVGEAIARATATVLRPKGGFLVYQFSSRVAQLLSGKFDRLETALQWRNIPPLRLYWAWRD